MSPSAEQGTHDSTDETPTTDRALSGTEKRPDLTPHGPSVTVVIPAFQAASTLDAALASVLGQTLPPTDVIVVDDGSTDGSADVASAWSTRLPLTVLRQPTAGAGPARDRGVAASNSDLIALLDADDVWLPDHLVTLIQTRAGVPDTLVFALGMRWIPGTALWNVDPGPLPPPARQLQSILWENFGCGIALFDRGLYDRVGGFRSGFRIGEDWDLWIRMVRAGALVKRSSHPTFLYRMSSSSATGGGRSFGGAEAVLIAAEREATTEEEVRWARDGLRHQPRLQRRSRASGSLDDAYAAARHGDGWTARKLGLRCLPGTPRVAARGLALAAAPSLVVRLRDRVNPTKSSG